MNGPDGRESPMATAETEKLFHETIEKGRREDSPYDALVLFSGGKDSTYLAHLMKTAGGSENRVCLFAVDNGFEGASFADHARKTAARLGCDLYLFKPSEEDFVRFYRFLLTEPALKEMDGNPLCFFCGRYLMSLGIDFAERNGIPLVAYGATPDQVHLDLSTSTPRDIRIFEMASAKVFMKNHKKVKELSGYRNDPVVGRMMDRVFHKSHTVKLVFPFLYVEYHAERIKETLVRHYGWQNPSEGLDNGRYLTSGCELVQLFGLLARKAGFKLHEPEQFQRDHARGVVSDEAYEHNMALLEDIMEARVSPEVERLLRKLGLEKELLGE